MDYFHHFMTPTSHPRAQLLTTPLQRFDATVAGPPTSLLAVAIISCGCQRLMLMYHGPMLVQVHREPIQSQYRKLRFVGIIV